MVLEWPKVPSNGEVTGKRPSIILPLDQVPLNLVDQIRAINGRLASRELGNV
jgi:hypothetical protein